MPSSMVATMLLPLGVYLILQHQYHAAVYAAPSTSEGVAAGSSNLEGNGQRGRSRPFLQASSRASPYFRAHILPLDPPGDAVNDFVIEDDIVDFNKRQSSSDDYGHMRFGKREQFDDYGHMRFGRSLD